MFNVNEIEASEPRDFELIKPDFYDINCDSADLKHTKNGDLMWSFRLSIHGSSDFDGRKLFPTCMYTHANPVTVRIGKTQLADICFAAGIEGFSSPDELISLITDRQWKAKVGIKLNKGKGIQENYCETHYTTSGEHRSYDALPQTTKAPARKPEPVRQAMQPQDRTQQQYEQQSQPQTRQPAPQPQRQAPWQSPQSAPPLQKPVRQAFQPTEDVPF